MKHLVLLAAACSALLAGCATESQDSAGKAGPEETYVPTGSLIAPGLVPFPEPDVEEELGAETAEAEDDDDEEASERLSVDDTMLVVSQTTLLRLNELQRLTKHRNGDLPPDRPEDGKKA